MKDKFLDTKSRQARCSPISLYARRIHTGRPKVVHDAEEGASFTKGNRTVAICFQGKREGGVHITLVIIAELTLSLHATKEQAHVLWVRMLLEGILLSRWLHGMCREKQGAQRLRRTYQSKIPDW